MIKYFKEYFSNYAYADVLQLLILIGFILFFVSLVYLVMKKPKKYYKEVSELPLEDDDPLI